MSRLGLPGNQLPVKQPQLPPVSALTAAPRAGPGAAASPGGTAAFCAADGHAPGRRPAESPQRSARPWARPPPAAGDARRPPFPRRGHGDPAAATRREAGRSGVRGRAPGAGGLEAEGAPPGAGESWGLSPPPGTAQPGARPPRAPCSEQGTRGWAEPPATPRWGPGKSRSHGRRPEPLPSRRGSWPALRARTPPAKAHTPERGSGDPRVPTASSHSRGLHPSVRPSVRLPVGCRSLSLLLPARATHPQLVLLCFL